MKKTILTLIIAVCYLNVFAQKTIIKPEHGISTFQSSIEKIELLDTTTVIHFQYKSRPGSKYSIPKKTFIQDATGGEKLYITKAGQGITLNKWQTMPESGEIFYKLYFPKLPQNTKAIDFGEDIDKASWAIYDIVLIEDEDSQLIPKALRGNWLKTDGSNQWEYSFLRNKAIIDAAVWNYKSVKTKRNKYTIILEKNGQLKTVYAKINKNGQASIGENKKDLKPFSQSRTKNPNYQLSDDAPYKLPIFNIGQTTYTGVVNGYTPKIGQSTTMVHVNNAFTGNQESHLVKIAEDGSFSITFPVAYPQFVYVRGVGVNMNVFVEPGKETFHFIDSGKHLFMGDCAQVNTDLLAMKSINYFNYDKVFKDILTVAPEDFKKRVADIQNREMDSVNKMVKEQFISQKALQLKKLDIEVSALENILSYEIYKSSAVRRQKKENNETAPIDETPLDASYYDVITKEMLDNKLAVMASQYKTLINRIMFADIFRGQSGVRMAQSLTTAQLADGLEKLGVELTEAEQQMVEASKAVQTESLRKRKNAFDEEYSTAFTAFLKRHYKVFNEIGLDEEKSLNIVASLKAEGIELNSETESMLQDYDAITSLEEKKARLRFTKNYDDVVKAFYKKHSKEISEIYSQSHHNRVLEKMQDILGVEETFVFDVVKLQQSSGTLERNMEPYSDTRVAYLQNQIATPFLSQYVAVENDKLKAKIEANKIKEGYTVNKVEKSEGDELFDALIKKYRGKVVYVDFWATWCGPCKSGIKRIKPLKEEMKDDDVVFLYITGPSSPETTWKNSIPDIKGEHYRVTSDEWNYLKDKFKITGIPHYTLVDKKGSVVKEKLGHLPNNKLKTLLLEEAGK